MNKILACMSIGSTFKLELLTVSNAIITWDKTVWVLKKFLGRDVALAQGKRFLEFPNLKFLKVDGSTVSRAQ